MNNTTNELLSYKGYSANVNYSIEDMVFHGRLTEISDLVTFEAKDLGHIQDEFHKAVDDYIKQLNKHNKKLKRDTVIVTWVKRNYRNCLYVEVLDRKELVAEMYEKEEQGVLMYYYGSDLTQLGPLEKTTNLNVIVHNPEIFGKKCCKTHLTHSQKVN